jgi:SAM-dependent methyltransferase
MTSAWLPGVHPSANIQGDPDLYEIENRAADPDGRIEQAMWQIAPWQDRVVLDLGAGTGFHLERFHRHAQQVIAVEPDGRLRLLAMERVARLGLERVSVLAGSAERLLLADASVGVARPGAAPARPTAKQATKKARRGSGPELRWWGCAARDSNPEPLP